MEDKAVIWCPIAGCMKSVSHATQPLYGIGQLRYSVMSFVKILWLWELASSWKASFIINLNIVQNYDRQDTDFLTVELGKVGGYRHYACKVRFLAFFATCILEQDYFS